MAVLLRTLLIVLALGSQNLYAVEVKRLYEVEVIAKSNRLEDKDNAIRQALKIVLSRILAGNGIFQDSEVKNILANAKRYVSEFQFSLGGGSISENNTRILRVLFNEKLLVAKLRFGKKGFWNEIRPKTLVWLVVEENGEQNFFDSGVMPELDLALDKASRRKGLPAIYPIQDLDEKRSLSISDVLSAYSEHLLEVSSRYDVVSTLAGKVVDKGSCWQAEWTLYFDAKITQWRSHCSSISKVTLNGFQGLYDRLSLFYAAKPARLNKKSKAPKAIVKNLAF